MSLSTLVRGTRLQAMMARHLVNWQDVWTAYSAESPMPVLRFRNGMIIHHGPRDSAGLVFLEVFANRCYRTGAPARLEGDILDIGANIGGFTLDSAWRHPAAVVHAYEPESETRRMLTQNVEANGLSGRVRIWGDAVAGTAGTLRLWHGDGSLISSAHLAEVDRVGARDVTAVTLSTVVARTSGRVALMKMDCEGAEVGILENAGASLQAVEQIVAEYHPALVPDSLARIQRALEPDFDVVATSGGRCGDIIRASRAVAEVGR